MIADDMDLVREYARSGSEEAFAALVSRHIHLVYSVARREVQDTHLAEEITQAVFIVLARKAGSLKAKTILSGWLCRTAQNISANALKIQRRRQIREQEAYMQSVSNEPESEAWSRIAPLLNAAMAHLGEDDHNALVLRFFEDRSLNDVGAALGVSEVAARKRVSRAIEKLRRFFARRGVVLSAAVIAGAISGNSIQAAPAVLAKAVTTVALAKGAAASGSTLTLIKGALSIMAWTKAKTAAVAVTAVILTTGTTTVVVKYMATGRVPVFGTSIDDSFFEGNLQKLQSAPANLLIVRSTHFSQISGPLWISGRKGAEPNSTRMSGRCVTLESVLESAYGFPASRMILPSDLPKDKFDFLVTVPGNAREQFQAAIAKQLGLVARREQRDQDVFLLKLRAAGAPGLKPGKGGGSSSSGFHGGPQGKYEAKNAPISALARYLEQNALKQVVIDQTGLTGRYDYELDGRVFNSEQELRGALLTQLGLELAPSREPIEMLVVEKAP